MFFPDTYQLMKIEVTDEVAIDVIEPTSLTPDWRQNGKETQLLGDSWLETSRSALLSMPSAPSPESTNYLLNPRHPEAKNVTIVWSQRMEYDSRLFRIRE